jgi:hypothetical protein
MPFDTYALPLTALAERFISLHSFETKQPHTSTKKSFFHLRAAGIGRAEALGAVRLASLVHWSIERLFPVERVDVKVPIALQLHGRVLPHRVVVVGRDTERHVDVLIAEHGGVVDFRCRLDEQRRAAQQRLAKQRQRRRVHRMCLLYMVVVPCAEKTQQPMEAVAAAARATTRGRKTRD